MIPAVLKSVYAHLEEVHALEPDEKEKALANLEEGLIDLLGRTRTYRNDNRLAGGSPEQSTEA